MAHTRPRRTNLVVLPFVWTRRDTCEREQSGQATVEHLAVVIVVAVMLAGAGAWIASHVRPDATPPGVVTQVWSGLERIPEPEPAPPDLGLLPRSGRVGTPTHLWRRVVRVARRGHAIVAVGTGAFVFGFGHGLWGAVTELVRDPVALLTGGGALIIAVVRDPIGFARAQVDAAVIYANELRKLPPEAASRRLMRDLGEATADAALTGAKQIAKKSMLNALKRRLEQRGEPTAPPPRDKRDGN